MFELNLAKRRGPIPPKCQIQVSAIMKYHPMQIPASPYQILAEFLKTKEWGQKRVLLSDPRNKPSLPSRNG